MPFRPFSPLVVVLLVGPHLSGVAGLAGPASAVARSQPRTGRFGPPIVRDAAAAYLKKVRGPIRRGFAAWLFTYADVRPFDNDDVESRLFLATNLGFFATGAVVATTGNDPILGLMCELAGTFSVGYHYTQCEFGGSNKPVVQCALTLDYLFAIPTLLLGLNYALSLGDALPASAVGCSVLAFLSLLAGWVWTGPLEFFILHGLWHVFGCLAGLELSAAHATLA